MKGSEENKSLWFHSDVKGFCQDNKRKKVQLWSEVIMKKFNVSSVSTGLTSSLKQPFHKNLEILAMFYQIDGTESNTKRWNVYAPFF